MAKTRNITYFAFAFGLFSRTDHTYDTIRGSLELSLDLFS